MDDFLALVWKMRSVFGRHHKNIEKTKESNMKKSRMRILLTSFVVLVALTVAGLVTSMVIPEPVHANILPVPDPLCAVTTQLIAGQYYDVGDVSVSLENGVLTVTYQTVGDWFITETHVAVASSKLQIPQTKSGNPKIGRFGNETYHDPEVQTFTYSIPWTDGTPIYIATHAVVQEIDATGVVLAEETAWGNGESFGKNWSMCFVLDCN